MNVYDIFQVDDEAEITDCISAMSKKCGFTYFSVPTLNSMKQALEENTGRYFVVDGRFQRDVGKKMEFLGEEAADYIMRKVKNPKIILFSNSLMCREVAGRKKVQYVSKDDERQLFELISEMEGR
jgi:hypothetical protein